VTRIVTKVIITKAKVKEKNLFAKTNANANSKAKDLVSFWIGIMLLLVHYQDVNYRNYMKFAIGRPATCLVYAVEIFDWGEGNNRW